MKKSSHVHITERVLYTEVKRKRSVAYHRDPATIGFDLPTNKPLVRCRHNSIIFFTRRQHTLLPQIT